MYRAPAVSWKVGPAPLRTVGLAYLMLLCGLAVAVYCFVQPWGMRAAALVLSALVASLPVALALRRAHVGWLRWDGEQWFWSGFEDQVVKGLVCVLDVQVLLLLRLHGTSGAEQWLWLQSSDRSRWTALRRALVSSRTGVDASRTGIDR